MAHLVEFLLEDGGSIIVELAEARTGAPVPAGRMDGVVARARVTFEQAFDAVKPAIGAIIGRLQELPEKPTELEVEFGLKLSAEAGAYIASASTEAHYKVTLTWKVPTQDP